MDNPTAPLPASLAAFYRIAVAVLLPLGVQKGWWGQSDVANISALLVAAGHAAWGVWKTHSRQVRLNAASPTLR